ncbi:MAG: 30S ribosomal protein S18 [Candidatus Omnitrophota bacterium]|jgi:small subunit ribosomal protein S18
MFKPKSKPKLKLKTKTPKMIGFKKSCSFCKKEFNIDYKNIELLSHYISSRGKIVSRRVSGNCAKHQRKVTKEMKIARFLSIFPYLAR